MKLVHEYVESSSMYKALQNQHDIDFLFGYHYIFTTSSGILIFEILENDTPTIIHLKKLPIITFSRKKLTMAIPEMY